MHAAVSKPCFGLPPRGGNGGCQGRRSRTVWCPSSPAAHLECFGLGDACPETAAWRALESAEPEPLFVDSLAPGLAGSAAVREALALARPYPSLSDSGGRGTAGSSSSFSGSDGSKVGSSSGTAAEQAGLLPGQRLLRRWRRRRFCYSNVAARVWWFDRQLATALAGLAGGSSSSALPPRQVVVLGTGLDTRPWRLALPPGVAWFELDLPHVVATKRQQLEELGAQLDACTASSAAAHPLRAASWAALGADLCRAGWGEALRAAGLDSRRPVVWIAEGLLMYLSPGEAAACLREAADLSPPGSVLIAHNITTELLHLIQTEGSAAYAPFPPALVSTWRCGFPLASARVELAAVLAAAGWPHLLEATSRARIAAQLCSSSEGTGAGSSSSSGGKQATEPAAAAEVAGQVDFEARPDRGCDRWAVFFAASK